MPECKWFALCDNEATTTRRGPVGGGEFGEIPICERCDVKTEAIDKGWSEELVRWCREAHKLGTIKAEDAASWTVDGNTSQEHIQRVLHMMDEGDPAVDHFLPNRPNMSGEWADAPTTNSVIEGVTGKPEEQIAHEDREAILNAWEEGVSERFESACEEELRKAAA